MARVQMNIRCTPQEHKLFVQAAAASGMSMTQFIVGSAKLLAVLGLHKEAKEQVVENLAVRLGGLLEKLDAVAGPGVRSKQAS